MTRRRIDYDADDGSDYARMLSEIGAYRAAIDTGDMARAAGAADRASHLAEALADQALLDSAEAERSLAADMGIARGTLQYRIKRARAHSHGATSRVDGDAKEAHRRSPADIVSRLRAMDIEEDGAAWFDAQSLDRTAMLAVATELGLTRVERLSRVELRRRVLKQAIGARHHFG